MYIENTKQEYPATPAGS